MTHRYRRRLIELKSVMNNNNRNYKSFANDEKTSRSVPQLLLNVITI